MNRKVWVALCVFVLSALLLVACGGGDDISSERQSPPADYTSMTNPFEGDANAVTAGQTLFETNCAGCHGATAAGDGAAGASLDPKPANLQATVKETDPVYTHWVISEGGAAAGLSSSMPPYKGILSDDEIWQVVNFLETTYGK